MNLLIPLIERSAPARIISVSSGGDVHAADQDRRSPKRARAVRRPTVYARTKHAEVIFTEMWAQRLAGTGVAVDAMDPGWADTAGVRSSLPRSYKVTRPLLRTAAEGADTIVWLAAAEEPVALTYRIVEHDPRTRSRSSGENATVTSRDRITFEAIAGGTRVTYDADLRLNDPL